jgi:ABC-type transport system substrate-binding protein
MQTAPITEPDYFYTYFHSSRIPDPKTLVGHNRWRWQDPDFDRAVEQARRDSDPGVRFALYARAQKLLADQVPVIPLWHEDNVVIRNVDVSGYRILPSASLGGLGQVRKRGR